MFKTIEYLVELAGSLIDKFSVPYADEALLFIAMAVVLDSVYTR